VGKQPLSGPLIQVMMGIDQTRGQQTTACVHTLGPERGPRSGPRTHRTDPVRLDHHMTVDVFGAVHGHHMGTLDHDRVAHAVPLASMWRSAAKRTASTIFSYPVHRHRFPARASLISVSPGVDIPTFTVRFSRSSACMSRPGVQNPHWTAPASTKASCTIPRDRFPASAPWPSPSTVPTLRPSACPAAI